LAALVIDLHTHVLPGLDDGTKTHEDALALARAAADDGIVQLAATPHLRADHPGVDPFSLRARCDDLNRRLRRARLDVEVVPGGEVDLYWAQAASDEALGLVSYEQRGDYLLVETPYGPLPDDFEELLFRITVREFRVLLAHPERNPTLQRRPERLSRLLERGVLTQVTAGSLLNAQRRAPSRRLAEALVAEGRAHVLASDAHRAVAGRPVGLSAAAAAADRLGRGSGRRLTLENPAAILAGEKVDATPAEASAGRVGRLLRRLR
jgi:protein-tyrosine phosphatase